MTSPKCCSVLASISKKFLQNTCSNGIWFGSASTEILLSDKGLGFAALLHLCICTKKLMLGEQYLFSYLLRFSPTKINKMFLFRLCVICFLHDKVNRNHIHIHSKIPYCFGLKQSSEHCEEALKSCYEIRPTVHTLQAVWTLCCRVLCAFYLPLPSQG